MKTESQSGFTEEAEAREAGREPSDEDLMLRFTGGDAGAMEEIIARHGRMLFGFLVRTIGSRDRAEDAYQEVFLRVVNAAPRYKPTAGFTVWLFTIARNVCIDLARRQRFRRTESLDEPVFEDGDASRIDTVASDDPDPEQEVMGMEMGDAIEQAISSLPGEQREVFLLREKSGLSFKEIAKLTGAPLNTVKTRMHYALKHMRKSLLAKGLIEEGQR